MHLSITITNTETMRVKIPTYSIESSEATYDWILSWIPVLSATKQTV